MYVFLMAIWQWAESGIRQFGSERVRRDFIYELAKFSDPLTLRKSKSEEKNFLKTAVKRRGALP
jgi:hypothetical protein